MGTGFAAWALEPQTQDAEVGLGFMGVGLHELDRIPRWGLGLGTEGSQAAGSELSQIMDAAMFVRLSRRVKIRTSAASDSIGLWGSQKV